MASWQSRSLLRSIAQVEDHIKKVESEYQKISDELAKGGQDGYTPKSGPQCSQCLRMVTPIPPISIEYKNPKKFEIIVYLFRVESLNFTSTCIDTLDILQSRTHVGNIPPHIFLRP